MVNEKVLTFEEFRSGGNTPRYNNFFLFFANGLGEVYRTEQYYRRFQTEHPDLAQSLCERIQQMDTSLGVAIALKPFERDLYEAYKIMREYDISNKDLFS
jgi:hypothetical protein